MNPVTSTKSFDAVVMGGSAGAMSVLLELLPTLPKSLRATVIVVLHMQRDRPSRQPTSFASDSSACCFSGANADGAAGLAAIGRASGLTMVQAPSSAQAQTMPLAGLAHWPKADYVASPAELATIFQDLHMRRQL